MPADSPVELTATDLDALEALLIRADRRGWVVDEDGDLCARVPTCWIENAWQDDEGRANAALVVAAVNRLPALIAAARAHLNTDTGYARGVEDAAWIAEELASEWDDQWRKGRKSNPHLEGKSDAGYEIDAAIRALPTNQDSEAG